MKKLIIACLFLSLFACGSKPPPETQYFVLTPSVISSTPDNKSLDKVLILEQIKIAKFLDQPGIVMKTDSHQIQVAHYHRWAEPIRKNMYRYILETLSGSLSIPVVDEANNINDGSSVLSLIISVNKFNGATDGTAVFSGEWLLIDKSTRSVKTKKSFNLKANLESDGYTELVNQLAKLVDKLCSDIASSLR